MMLSKRKIFFIFFLALALRLFFVFVYPQIPVESDTFTYDRLGWNLAQGKGFTVDGNYPEIIWGPGYPFFLSIIYRIFGHSYNYVKFFQIIVSLFTLVLIFFLANNIFNYKVALIATFIGSIYPPFLSYNALLLMECLFTFFIIFFLFLVWFSIKRKNWFMAFLAGIAGGGAALIREEFLVFLPVIFLLGIFHFKGHLKQILLIILVTFTVIMPWTIRNYNIFDKFVLVSCQGGRTLWISSHNEEWLEWRWRSEDPFFRKLIRGLNSVEQDNLLRKEGIKNIKEHPFIYVKFCFKRFFRFWIGSHSNTFYGMTNSFAYYIQAKEYIKVITKAALLIFNTLLILLGFLGFLISMKRVHARRKEAILLFMPVFTVTVIHFFLFATIRYQVPVMPFIIIFASYAIKNYYDLYCITRQRF